MAVRIIPAKLKMINRSDSGETRRLRVAGYARVSTDSEEQESSYEAQVTHFTDLINANPSWTLVEVYADEGISATTTEKRVNFNRMIADCEQRKIDMVITKSISRWARNTLDSLQYIRKLKDLDIPVVFEKEGINTLDASGELLITILSSLAQQESQSISQNVRIGIHYNFQRGKPMLNHTRFIGYTKKTRGGDLIIDPKGAVIVRKIFRAFLEGMTIGEIVRHLEHDHIKAPGGDTWYHGTVLRMLQNEKYKGDLLLQKSYTVDFLTKKRSRNNGVLPQYYVENAHEPIIPREVFLITQGELLRRKQEREAIGKQRLPSREYAMMDKLICGCCGAPYVRKASKKYGTVWRCGTRCTAGRSCDGPPVSEAAAQAAVVEAINRLGERREELLLEHARIRGGELNEITFRLVKTDQRVQEIQEIIQKYTENGELPGTQDRDGTANGSSGNVSRKERRTEKALAKLSAELNELNAARERDVIRKAELSLHCARIHEAVELSDAVSGRRTEPVKKSRDPACYTVEDFYVRTSRPLPKGPVRRYSEELVQRFVEKIIVRESGITVRFKAGIEI